MRFKNGLEKLVIVLGKLFKAGRTTRVDDDVLCGGPDLKQE